jgi:hypothetical protein
MLPLQLTAFTVAALRLVPMGARYPFASTSPDRGPPAAGSMTGPGGWAPEVYRMMVDGFGFHRLPLFVAGVSIWVWGNNRLRSRHFILLVVTCMAAHLAHGIVVGRTDGMRTGGSSWSVRRGF